MDIHGDARRYLAYHYLQTRGTDDEWSWDPRTEHPDRIWNDAFARYNTGRTIYSPNGNKGRRNCARNNTGCSYSATVRSYVDNPPW